MNSTSRRREGVKGGGFGGLRILSVLFAVALLASSMKPMLLVYIPAKTFGYELWVN